MKRTWGGKMKKDKPDDIMTIEEMNFTIVYFNSNSTKKFIEFVEKIS